MNSITLSNNVFRISDYSVKPNAILNTLFKFYDIPHNDNSSIRLKDKSELYLKNKIAIQKIKEFENLAENWDSYDSLKISKNSIKNAIQFIKLLNEFNEEVYFSSPGPNGEVLVHIKKLSKEIEFIFYPTKCRYVKFLGEDFIDQGDFVKEELNNLMNWLNEL